MIREFKEEIERLRKLLSEQGISLANGVPSQPIQVNNMAKLLTESSSLSPRAQPSEDIMSPLKPTPPAENTTPSSILQTSDVITSMETLSSHPSSDHPSKSTSRSSRSSPRAKNHIRSPRGNDHEVPRETVRVEKEYVEKIIEVEKIPESHLTKQKVRDRPL